MKLSFDYNRFYRLPNIDSWVPLIVSRSVIVEKVGELFTSDTTFKKHIPKSLREKPPLVLSGSSMQLERFPGIYIKMSSYRDLQYIGSSYSIGKVYGPVSANVQLASMTAEFYLLAESLDQRDYLITALSLALKSFMPGYYVVETLDYHYVLTIGPFNADATITSEETLGVFIIYTAGLSVPVLVAGGSFEHGYDMLYNVLLTASPS